MITGGIDIGVRCVKIVIKKEDEILTKKIGISGAAKREQNVTALWEEALRDAGVNRQDLRAVAVTGKGKYNISFADIRKTEVVCLQKAVQLLAPQATMALQMGADEMLAAVFDHTKPAGISEMTLNQKCAAGQGLLLENLANEFDWNPEEPLSWPGCAKALDNPETISDGCAVFARMDVLEAMNHGAKKEAVMAGVLHAAAVRAYAVIQDITLPDMDQIVLCGGLSRNPLFVSELEKVAGMRLPVLPNAQFIGAIGAAVAASERE
ncbi:MAG: acyl-CoA dehydratase activase [Lachnospiraceae bacterium]|nr:acyl-CoA dehydratase activase [Lachnospiraceae bacterium]